MGNKFPSLSSFLDSTKKLERSTLESALKESTDQQVQKILSESSVLLSVLNEPQNAADSEANKSKAEFIQESIKEASSLNASRVKSILDEIFQNLSLDKERELFWIQKLCNLFNIDKSLSIELKSALIEKQLAEDDDTLNYVQHLVETGERKSHS